MVQMIAAVVEMKLELSLHLSGDRCTPLSERSQPSLKERHNELCIVLVRQSSDTMCLF